MINLKIETSKPPFKIKLFCNVENQLDRLD